LRQWWIRQSEDPSGPNGADLDRLQSDLDVVWEYRTQFQDPLTRVTANLRYYVAEESSEVIIAQRLKRLPQIINKLARYPTQRLTQMQDIGGCRAILPGGLPEIRAVQRRLERRWSIIDSDDYISGPKATGYRALHLIERRSGMAIEVQLRTPAQHQWAEDVERAELRTRYPLKDGKGPKVLQRYYALTAEIGEARELGQEPEAAMVAEAQELRAEVEFLLASDPPQ
jgi:putative GTP pyrophosphokinase